MSVYTLGCVSCLDNKLSIKIDYFQILLSVNFYVTIMISGTRPEMSLAIKFAKFRSNERDFLDLAQDIYGEQMIPGIKNLITSNFYIRSLMLVYNFHWEMKYDKVIKSDVIKQYDFQIFKDKFRKWLKKYYLSYNLVYIYYFKCKRVFFNLLHRFGIIMF